MIIYLDFDGTVVDHKYPNIGEENALAFETIAMLQNAGHDVYLNTKRVEFNNDTLLNSLLFLYNHKHIKIKEFKCICSSKISPKRWDWKLMNETGIIYIDDIAPGIPLIKQSGKYPMVNWVEIKNN
jgi:acetone carboxylase gamma subunit